MSFFAFVDFCDFVSNIMGNENGLNSEFLVWIYENWFWIWSLSDEFLKVQICESSGVKKIEKKKENPESALEIKETKAAQNHIQRFFWW